MEARGSLVCIGLGMMLGAHLPPRARHCLDTADVVFVAVSDALVERWVHSLHPDVRSLQACYADGKPRQDTYRDMVDAMLTEVRAGKRVCGAFYGHPGVFARAPHDAIAQARREGWPASMEPGISAEDCLYADLAIDPGDAGCQHHAAGQFLRGARRGDASAHLVLWQAGMIGEGLSAPARAAQRCLLLDRLALDYPLHHETIAYEAATLAIAAPRIDRQPLSDLPDLHLRAQTTLVLPPARALRDDPGIVAALRAIEVADAAGRTRLRDVSDGGESR